MPLQGVSLPGCPWQPTFKQLLALNFYGRELLYGGAAGPGKSIFLLMAALQFIHVPGYNALVLRRTWPQLSQPKGMLDQAQQWFSDDGRFHGSKSVDGYSTVWAFDGGGTLSFGHMNLLKDRENYHGPPFHFVGYDETTQFVEGQYTYLFSRQRKPDDPDDALARVPLRMRGASNPGGVGMQWVRERFVKQPNTRDRIFLPGRLEDNPHLDQESYREGLAMLPRHEREMLEYGNWDAKPPGALFDRTDFPILDEAPKFKDEVRHWDLAATEAAPGKDPDYTAGVRIGRVANGRYVITDVVHGRWSEAKTEKRIKHTVELDGPHVTQRMEQEPGASGKLVVHNFRKLLEGYPLRGVPSTGSKYNRAKAYVAAVQRQEVALLRGPWNQGFLDEHEFVTFEGTEHDDQADAAAGAYNGVALKRGTSPSDLYGEGAPA